MKRKFSLEEVENLVWENEVKRYQGEDRRWSRTNISIVKAGDRFYELYWEEGLTENQPNDFYAQEAKEVMEVKKTVITSEWVEVGGEVSMDNFKSGE